jgi:hypothetical protein
MRALGLEGEHGLWAAAGGADQAGAGTVIADIDSGIAPDNPSFAGKPLGSTPGDEPYRDGTGIAFRKADGGVFHGACQTGDGFTAADCSTKLIGARRATRAGTAPTPRAPPRATWASPP